MDKSVYEKKLIDEVIASIEKYGGKSCLSSIILTGSFGRNEPTYSLDSDGGLSLKSDVEIALVFPKLSKKKQVEELIKNVSSEFIEDLNLMPINENRVRKAYNFNFTLRVPKFKTIFTYDLFNGSRTIWGRDFIGEKVIALEDVDPYEAKRLVANRIGELTYLQNSLETEKKSYFRIQWKGKLILAIVSAWLICEGTYVSSYHGQYDKVKVHADEIESLLGESFLAEYERVFAFLRENGDIYEAPDKHLENYVRRMDSYFGGKKLDRPKVNSVSRILKYMSKYMRTKKQYGIFQFENHILQALITDYSCKDVRLNEDAEVWHRVLY